MIKKDKKLREKALYYYDIMVKSLKGRLNERTIDDESKIRKYIEAHEKELKVIKGSLSKDDLIEKIKSNDAIFFGNFRTDNRQRYEFLDILERLHKDKIRFYVAIDLIPYRKRDLLAKYLKGELTKRFFLNELELDSSANPAFLESYLKILDFIKRKSISLLPLDLESVNEKNIVKKDKITAGRIANFFKMDKGVKLLCLVPDSWLAKGHLPLLFRKAMSEKGLKPKVMRIFSGSDQLYLKLAKGFQEVKSRIISVSENTYVFNLSHPVARYNSFFNYLDDEREIGKSKLLRQEFEGILTRISKAMGFNINISNLKFYLYSDFEINFIEKILTIKGFTSKEKVQILEYVLRGEGYFIPYGQIIYLGNLSKPALLISGSRRGRTLPAICTGRN